MKDTSKILIKIKKAEKKAKENAKKKGGAGAQDKANTEAFMCKQCRQTFMITAKPAMLRAHCESKHDKVSIGACFPHLAAAEEPEPAAAAQPRTAAPRG
eukprot:CAMPEP_0119494874 /NCGR_PEP_ID=MMETSP1344-20130328/18695_1 /TAXON_ID=236787 /ORGANISM="Florenciella parvula, Strain CCMP2471" /LENGTH=98 /DNA_ID=CAMNT_0007530417 /DNA_START=64 /DNA_END=357 /DNA_ORIENTATION=+